MATTPWPANRSTTVPSCGVRSAQVRIWRACGGRYSDDWQRAHLYNPRDVVPESNMPAYPWLFDNLLDGSDTAAKFTTLRKLGVPYTDEDIASAQENAESCPSAPEGRCREIDAVVAYLQQLGTLIKARR
jgi:cytochrome c oxidase cbb3-type subunit 2